MWCGLNLPHVLRYAHLARSLSCFISLNNVPLVFSLCVMFWFLFWSGTRAYISDADHKCKPSEKQGWWSPFHVNQVARAFSRSSLSLSLRWRKRFRQWHRIQHICRYIHCRICRSWTHICVEWRVNAWADEEIQNQRERERESHVGNSIGRTVSYTIYL